MYLLLTGFIFCASVSARPRDLNRQMQHIAQFGHQSHYANLQQYDAQNRHFDEELEQIQRTNNQLRGNILKTTKQYIESVENQKNSEPLKKEQRNIESVENQKNSEPLKKEQRNIESVENQKNSEPDLTQELRNIDQIKNKGINQESLEQLQTHTSYDDVETDTEKEENILQNAQTIPNTPVKDINEATQQERENSDTERDSETANQQNMFLNKNQINLRNDKDERKNQELDGLKDETDVPTKMNLAELEEQLQRLHMSSVSTIKVDNNLNQQHVTSPVQPNYMSSSTIDTHSESSNFNTDTNDRELQEDVHRNEQGLLTNYGTVVNTDKELEQINEKDYEKGDVLPTKLPELLSTSKTHLGGVDGGTKNEDKAKEKAEKDKIQSKDMVKNNAENKNMNNEKADEEEILVKDTLKDDTESRESNNEKEKEIPHEDTLKDVPVNIDKNNDNTEADTMKDGPENKDNDFDNAKKDHFKDGLENEDKNIEKTKEDTLKDGTGNKNNNIDNAKEDIVKDDPENKDNNIDNTEEDTLKIISEKHFSIDADKISYPSSIAPGAASSSSDVTLTFNTVKVKQPENDIHEQENEEVILSTRTEKQSPTTTVKSVKSTVTKPKSRITTHVKGVESIRTSRSPQKFGESPEKVNNKNNEDNEQNTDNTYDSTGCSDRLYTGSAVIASCVGGVFIGVFLILFLINARHKCKKYMNGDYRPVPMEYDFELNPRLKNH